MPDPDDLERVRRGHIASLTTPTIDGPDGRRVFHIDAYDFLRKGDPAPDTVNPNLWRHAVLNAHHGLFEVCVEHGMTPEIRIDGVGCWVTFAQEVVGIDVEHPSPIGPV
ncbi:MAG: hypothetical protein ACKOE7_05965, partial [Actinomycetota bacterium]